MSFGDIIKKSVFNEFTANDISMPRIIGTLLVVMLLAGYIFLIYYLYMQKSFYNRNFNITLAGVAIVTSAIVLALQSNFVISLGMVGALSIVRFRTAIKEPLDLFFLFWSISVGIICGAGLFSLALVISLIISLALFLLQLSPLGRAGMLLVIKLESMKKEEEVTECVEKYYKGMRVRTRNIAFDRSVSMIIELKVKEPGKMLEEITGIDGVKGVSLVSHDGEVNF